MIIIMIIRESPRLGNLEFQLSESSDLFFKRGRNAGSTQLELPQLRKSFGTCKGCRSLSREPNGDFLRENKQEIYRWRALCLKRKSPTHIPNHSVSHGKYEAPSEKDISWSSLFWDIPGQQKTGHRAPHPCFRFLLRLALGRRSALGIFTLVKGKEITMVEATRKQLEIWNLPWKKKLPKMKRRSWLERKSNNGQFWLSFIQNHIQ